MSWKFANRAVLATPALPAAYFAGLNFLASAAGANEKAKTLLAIQVDLMIGLLTSAANLACVAFAFCAWLGLIWLTDWMSKKEEKRTTSLVTIAQRADLCSQGILRMLALHKQKEAVAAQHAWQNNQRLRDVFVSSASLMNDYSMLYAVEALSVLKAAERRGLPLDEFAMTNAERPTNPIGVEQVAHNLAILADRIRTNDI